jgi:hypothetical protein
MDMIRHDDVWTDEIGVRFFPGEFDGLVGEGIGQDRSAILGANGHEIDDGLVVPLDCRMMGGTFAKRRGDPVPWWEC